MPWKASWCKSHRLTPESSFSSWHKPRNPDALFPLTKLCSASLLQKEWSSGANGRSSKFNHKLICIISQFSLHYLLKATLPAPQLPEDFLRFPSYTARGNLHKRKVFFGRKREIGVEFSLSNHFLICYYAGLFL